MKSVSKKAQKQKMKEKEKQRLASKRQRELRDNMTLAEKALQLKLKKIPIKFISQKCFYAGDYFCIVDFYIPKPFKICIEVDGGYHDTGEQKERDDRKELYLMRDRGFRVLRLTNELAMSIKTEELAEIIYSFMKQSYDKRVTKEQELTTPF